MKSTHTRIALISFLLVLLIPNVTYAEMKTIIKEYTYQASEDDSRNSSRTIALREVKRLLLEELGTYLESVTEVKNFQLTKDQITVLTAGIVRTEIVDEKWDGHTYRLKSKITADSGEVIKSIDTLRKDRAKTKELEELKRRSDELLRENENLRKELAAKDGNRQKQESAYNRNIKELTAIEWFEKGYSSAISGNYKDAIDAFSKAIEMNKKHAAAYNNRGYAYNNLGKYDQAMQDYEKAIEINPEDDVAYYNRGVAYGKLGKDNKAVENYGMAIKINPKYADAYSARGITYGVLGNYQQAIRDLDRAIELNPKNAPAYYVRAIACKILGNYKQALQDYKMAAKLGHKGAQDYLTSKEIKW